MRGKALIILFAFVVTTLLISSGLPWLKQETHAAGGVGSSYIARAGTGSLITDLDGTEQTLTYDTEVQTSTDIVRQTGNQAFRIQNSGRYLVVANTRFNYADIGNNNRHVVRSLIKLGGTDLPSVYGMASGYGRDNGSADEDGAVVAAYIDHTVAGDSSDDITIHVQNFGDTTVSLADQLADQSGIQIVRLPDDSEYLKVKRTSDITFTGTMDYSVNDPAWNEFAWESQDAETDTSVLEWVSGNDITLKSAGHYLVLYSIRADTTGNNRRGAAYRLKLNDVEVHASRVINMMRGNDGATESWTQWGGIVEASASDILNIDWGSVSETAGGALNEAAITVVKLPDTASYLRVRYNASRAGETTGAYPFNIEDEDDANVHDSATNNSRISGDANNHDWLLFASWFARNATANSTRVSEHFRWFRTGTEIPYGSGLSYHRGDQASTGIPAAGRNAVIVADALGSSEYIELDLRHESGTGDQNRDFIANRVGITGVALDTLEPAVSISLSTNGSVSFGVLELDATEDTTASGINDAETVSVDTGPADLDIKSTTFSDGTNIWTLATATGSDQVKWESSKEGTTWTTFAVADTLYTLDTNVAQSQTRNVYLRLTMPSSTGSYAQHSSTITIVASAP